MNQNVPISKRLLLINAVSGVVTRILNVAIIVWVVRYLLQRISAEEYSILPIVMAVMAMLPIITTVFTWSLSRHLTEAYARGELDRVTSIASTMFTLLVPVGLVILASGLLITAWADVLLKLAPDRVGEARFMLSVLFGQFVLRMVVAPFSLGLFVHQRFVVLNAIELAGTVARLLLLAFLLFVFGPRVIWVVVAQVVSYLLQDAARVILSMRLMPSLRFRRRSICWKTARTILGFNMWSVVNHIAWFIHDSAPFFILNQFGSPANVVAMHMGSMADLQLRSLVQAGTFPVVPALTAMHATDQLDRLRNSFIRGCRASFWLIMCVIVCIVVFRDELMRLYLGEAFEKVPESGLVVGMLLAAYVSYLPRLMLMKVSVAQGRVGVATSCNLASQLANLALTSCAVILFRKGAVGAALSTLLIEIVWHLFCWWPLSVWIVKLEARKYITAILVPGLAPAVACAAFVEILRRSVHPSSVLAVGLCSFAGLLMYLSVLFNCCLSQSDRADLRIITTRVIGRWRSGHDTK